MATSRFSSMELNFTAPINELGYGVAGLNILKGLVRNGCNVSYWPIGQPSIHSQEDYDVYKMCTENSVMFNYEAPSLRLWHQHDMAQHIGSGKRIGFPIFELDTFSELEKHNLDSLDNIIVCSKWAKSIIEKEVPNKKFRIGIAPLGVDTNIFTPKQNPFPKQNKTIFLNIGKWEIRKGHDILIESFNKAFNENDNVELWMMNHNPFLDEKQEKEWHSTYQDSKLGAKVKIIPRVKTHMEVAAIMNIADVGVFPSRAEGWNLEALEMMALGKQVILTDYSAHTEFATDKNSKLINIENTEPAYDGIWFRGQGEWAEIGEAQKEQLIEYMRECHKEKGKINEGGIETSKTFTWDNCAKSVMSFCGMMQGF
jgi:glycosyltransferase involved in cell wall biosynthesis